MTLEQFLEKLEQTPRDWVLDAMVTQEQALSIRRGFMQCPISAMRDGMGSNYPSIAKELGLDIALANDIAKAADASPEGYDPELRAKLLKACGLEVRA